MKKVLYVTYRNIYPVTSGEKITMMQNLQILSKYFDVDCLMLSEKELDEQHIDYLKRFSKNVFHFNIGNIFVRSYFCLLALFSGKPLQNGYFYSKKMNDFIQNNYVKYDFIFCVHMRTGQYVLNIKNIKKIIDCPDSITLNSLNEYKKSKGIRKLLFKIDYLNVKKFEKNNYMLFDLIYVISKRDEHFLVSLNPKLTTKTRILYNHARDLGYKEEYNIISKEPSICFMGKMSYGPNIIAIKFFVENIFPAIKAKYPNVIFNLYGGDVSPSIKKLSKMQGIKIHGFVDDISREIQSNHFVVAPMISGSGTQNKILECMYLKKLVITTELGADGLENLSGKEIIIAKNKEDFIDKCIFYLDTQNTRKRTEIGELARGYIINNYSKQKSEEQLLCPLMEVLKS